MNNNHFFKSNKYCNQTKVYDYDVCINHKLIVRENNHTYCLLLQRYFFYHTWLNDGNTWINKILTKHESVRIDIIRYHAEANKTNLERLRVRRQTINIPKVTKIYRDLVKRPMFTRR